MTCITCRHYNCNISTFKINHDFFMQGNFQKSIDYLTRYCTHPKVVTVFKFDDYNKDYVKMGGKVIVTTDDNTLLNDKLIPKPITEQEFQDCPKWCPIYGDD